jgi:enolase
MIEDVKVSRVTNSAKKESIKAGIISNKKKYSASIPGGTSRGAHEAVDVTFKQAEEILQQIKKDIVGMKEDYRLIDAAVRKFDNTKNFSKVGGNLSLALDLATARAQTNNELWKINGKKSKFPVPLVNVIGGGKHGGNTDFQEFLILPDKEKSFPSALKKARQTWKYIGSELKKKKLLAGRNLENAWITKMNDTETLEFLRSLELQGVKFGMDCAASSLWDGTQYVYSKSNKKLSKQEHFEFIESILDEFGIFYVEDPFHEEDFESFAELTGIFKKRLVVGDDLTTTNPERFKIALQKDSASGIIIKPNQVGSLVLAEEVIGTCYATRDSKRLSGGASKPRRTRVEV